MTYGIRYANDRKYLVWYVHNSKESNSRPLTAQYMTLAAKSKSLFLVSPFYIRSDFIPNFGALAQYTSPQRPIVNWCSKYFVLSFFLYQFQLAINFVTGSLRRVPILCFLLLLLWSLVCTEGLYKAKKINAGIVCGYRILCTTIPRINWLLLNVFHFRRWAFSLTKSILLHFVSLFPFIRLWTFSVFISFTPIHSTHANAHVHLLINWPKRHLYAFIINAIRPENKKSIK